MLKKGKQLTAKDLKKEQKKFKKITPVYENTDITQFERYVSNFFYALTDATTHLKINKEYIEMVIWLYQFEFFEREWVYEHFKSCYMRLEVYGERSAMNRFNWLLDNEYIEPYSHEKYSFQTWERSHNCYTMQDVESDVKYKISKKGLDVVRVYMSKLTQEPLSKIDKRKNRLLFKGQVPWDNLDYSDF